MTDFRALCTELLNELHGYASANPHHDSDALVARARAALAAPPAPAEGEVGEGLEPTHEQIRQWINANPVLRPESTGGPMIRVGTDWLAAFADAARWGARFHTTAPAVVPIPVSERLPGPEDCDDQKRCWWLVLDQSWPCLYLTKDDLHAAAVASHWLPAHALPLPSGEVEG